MLTGYVFTAVACAAQTDEKPADPGGTGSNSDSGASGYPDSNGGLDATVPGIVTDGGKTPKPKALGSPCSADTDCAGGLSCNATFPNGVCTKACTADTDCAGKGGATGACVNGLCFALCSLDADGGAIVSDGGKVKSPCKNKSFECATIAGRAEPVCVPPDDAGTEPIDSGLPD